MFGHPLHPIAVHLPVILLLSGVLLDLASLHPRFANWQKAGLIHLLLGLVGALAALVTGFVDAAGLGSSAPEGLLANHTLFAVLTTVAFGLMLGVRMIPGRRGAVIYSCLAVIGVGLMVATGYTGGDLVYRYGVGMISAR